MSSDPNPYLPPENTQPIEPIANRNSPWDLIGLYFVIGTCGVIPAVAMVGYFAAIVIAILSYATARTELIGI